MQFAWLVLIPVGLGNILLTGMLYLLLNSLGAPITVFLLTVGFINWILLFFFIRWVRHATNTSTRKASAPAIRDQRRTLRPQEKQPPVPVGIIDVAAMDP